MTDGMGMRRLTAVLVLGLIGCAGLGKNQDLVTGGAPLDQWCPEGLTLTANNGNPEPGTTPRFLYVGCELEPDLAHGPTMVWRTDAKQMIALMFMPTDCMMTIQPTTHVSTTPMLASA